MPLAIMSYIKKYLVAEKHSWILWIPVIFALGIIFYFCFGNPNNSYLSTLSLIIFAIFVTAKIYEQLSSLIAISILLFLSGFLWAKFYDNQFVQAPIINSKTYGTVIGKIETIKFYEEGKKNIILTDLNIYKTKFEKKAKKTKKKPTLNQKPIKINKNIQKTYLNIANYSKIDRKLNKKPYINHFKNHKYQNPPKKISLLVRKTNKNIEIGDIIKVKTLLQPFEKTDNINSFNFSRNNYFKQIGGSGFAISNIKILEKNLKSKQQRINFWRFKIAEKINKNFNKNEAAILNALLLGVRDFIEPNLMQNIRNSGLAHLIAISGLHLTLASLIFFIFFRFLLSRSEFFTLHFNIKKIAAILAIISGFSYLIIAGTPISALRAFFMILVIFLGILFDRNSNPLRSLACAALILLIINPTIIFSISFQMSFLAILALITFYNLIKEYLPENENPNILQKFIYYFLGVIFSSLIAQIALAPLTIYYFNNYALLGILANLIAVPLTSFVIMPLAFIYLFLSFFNLEIITIYPLDFALKQIIKTANYVSNFEFSNLKISLISTTSLVTILIGFLWLALWQEKWRNYGLVVIILGILLAYKTPIPNLIIDGKRQFFAIYDEEKGLFFSKKVRNSFRVKNLMQKMAQSEFKTIKELKNEEIFCKYEFCQAKIKKKQILILTKRNKIDELCQKQYDILVNLSKFMLPNCIDQSKKIIDNTDLLRSGSKYLFI